MSAARPSQQLADLFTYLLIPGMAIILPVSFSRWVIRSASRWQWLMAAAADAALQGAREFVEIEDAAEFKKRWKQVELLDVCDLYMMLCGRSRSVFAGMEHDASLKGAKDCVFIGMHWGPSISVLNLLKVAGLNPAAPYRPPEKEIFRIRPFYYLFSSMAGRYIVKTMGARAVPVGGAGKVLRAMMDQPGSVLVGMDAPPMAGRPTLSMTVLGKKAIINAGLPSMIVDKKKQYVFYAISLEAGDSVKKKLEIEGPFSADAAEEFLQNFAHLLDRHLSSDPAQWRIWHVARQFWR